LTRFLNRVKGGGCNFIADKIFSEQFFAEDVEKELRKANVEFDSFNFFIDTDGAKNSLQYMEVEFGSTKSIPLKDLRSFSLFSSLFMTVKKSDGFNPELIYGVIVKKDDSSRRGGVEPESGEVRVRYMFFT